MKANKNIAFNRVSVTIRGSFVNLFITFAIMVLVMIGAFVKEVRENLQALETLIIGFYGISFGVWRAGKHFDKKAGCEESNE